MSLQNNVIADAKRRNISFSKSALAKEVDALIQKSYYDGDKYENVESSFEKDLLEQLEITAEEEQELVNLQKVAPFLGSKEAAGKFLPIALYNIRNKKVNYSHLTAADGLDPSVEYFVDESRSNQEYVKENIEFAAQLYYVMVMGDELEVFNAADALITQHLRSKKYNVDIRSRPTMDAVRLYGFSEKFEHLKTREQFQRFTEAERMMFYKQVFNLGEVAGMDDFEANVDFEFLWNTLMEEVTAYIEKVEDSGSHENVSRNSIYQAIEDLQYNLSNNCTGLAKVASSVMNMELNFIMKRLFDDKDIKEQIGKRDRTPFGVLKQILLDLNEKRGMKLQNIIALNNKAVLGHKIISEIARFSEAYMDTGNNFGKFITKVQLFFKQQQVLEKGTRDVPGLRDLMPGNYMPGQGSQPPQDEWDF